MGFSLSFSSFLPPLPPPLFRLPLHPPSSSSLLLCLLPLSFFFPQFELQSLLGGFSPFTFIVIIDTISIWSFHLISCLLFVLVTVQLQVTEII